MTGSSVPIGWPVWNTGLRILDAAMRPVPPGAGDLYLTGIQLAQAIWDVRTSPPAKLYRRPVCPR
ncbi:hypothetical protein LNO81_07015 [Klebsiella variicola subsp. variicola]|nr:hypothetical protein [Klebsiella variicola subsp. variicola]